MNSILKFLGSVAALSMALVHAAQAVTCEGGGLPDPVTGACPNTVPEPATLPLVGLAIVIGVLVARRKK